MIVVPAIDLLRGRCVRLERGEKGSEKVYSDDPVATARQWESEGASLLHLVDLDAAFGEPPQRETIADIVRAVRVPVQVGGGIRSDEHFAFLRDCGARRVVFGTVAVEEPGVVERALETDPAAVALAVDVKRGKVALRGWTESAGLDPTAFGRTWAASGVEIFIYTETARDGMREGVDVEATGRFARDVGKRVIASGGVGSLEHLRALEPLARDGVEGVIVGRALYDRAFTLAEARGALGG